MAKERVTENLLPADFSDGDILHGNDINKIISVLRTATNINKFEIDRLLAGTHSEYVFNTLKEADDYLIHNLVYDGQSAVVMSDGALGDEIGIYEYKSVMSMWEFKETLSFLKQKQDIDQIKKQLNTSFDMVISSEEPEEKRPNLFWGKVL